MRKSVIYILILILMLILSGCSNKERITKEHKVEKQYLVYYYGGDKIVEYWIVDKFNTSYSKVYFNDIAIPNNWVTANITGYSDEALKNEFFFVQFDNSGKRIIHKILINKQE